MCGRLRMGRKLAKSSKRLRSSTLMLEKPPLMGVVTGPFSPTRVRSMDSLSSLGMYSWYFSKASAPAAKLSHSNLTPVASIMRTVAWMTSGPIPSPGIRVTLCAILKTFSQSSVHCSLMHVVSTLQFNRALPGNPNFAHSESVGAAAASAPPIIFGFAFRISVCQPLRLRLLKIVNGLLAKLLGGDQRLLICCALFSINFLVHIGQADRHAVGCAATLRLLVLRRCGVSDGHTQ